MSLLDADVDGVLAAQAPLDERVTLSLAHLCEKRLETELDERQQSGDCGATTLINVHEGISKKKKEEATSKLNESKAKSKIANENKPST